VKRFHITENGPKPCEARIRDCPVGGEHFKSKEEAEAVYEFIASKKYGLFGVASKDSNPYKAHVRRAERRIKAMEKDLRMRDARQNGGTIYAQLIKDGFDDKLITERLSEETNQREGGVGLLSEQFYESSPVVGLTYGGDFKAEEEYGLAHIAKGLHDGTYAKDDVVLVDEGETTYLVIRGERTYDWRPEDIKNPETSSGRAWKIATDRYENYTSPNDIFLKMRLNARDVDELRSHWGKIAPAGERKPLTKKALISRIVELEKGAPKRKPMIGEFQTGSALTLVSKDPFERKMMQKMKEAHDAGALRVGSSSNPFGSAALFYDDRDLPRIAKTNQIYDEEANKNAKAFITPTRTELEKNGYVYAVSPRVSNAYADIREAKFWLNYSPKNHKQISGLFTKQELDLIASGDYTPVKERK